MAYDISAVNHREDRGDWGTLGDTKFNWFDISDIIINSDSCLSIGEERLHPTDDGNGKAGVPEDADKAAVVDIVKESFNING